MVEKTLNIHLQELREDIAQKIEAIEIKVSIENAVGFKALAAAIARGQE